MLKKATTWVKDVCIKALEHAVSTGNSKDSPHLKETRINWNFGNRLPREVAYSYTYGTLNKLEKLNKKNLQPYKKKYSTIVEAPLQYLVLICI